MRNSANLPVILKAPRPEAFIEGIERATDTIVAIRHAHLIARLVYPHSAPTGYTVVSLAEHIGDQWVEASQEGS